jgi:hypothetical protein
MISQAKEIVKSHRPKGVPSTIEPVCMAGLNPKDHGRLNGVVNLSNEKASQLVAKMRNKYSKDLVALQQIEAYEFGPEYAEKLKDYINAQHSRDKDKIENLEAWFSRFVKTK